jgi:hypothetical protein
MPRRRERVKSFVYSNFSRFLLSITAPKPRTYRTGLGYYDVNNHYEGSATLTVERLVQKLAE